MSIGVILTIIFLVLKYLGMISWPLFNCFIPLIIEAVVDVVIFLAVVIFGVKLTR
jgi:hypothetical protein